MRTIYIDCSMGAAGDMLMAALLALHPDPEGFLQRLNAALPENVTVTAEHAVKRGISGTHVHVVIDGEEEGREHGHHHPHTNIQEIYAKIDALPVPEAVRRNTRAVYERIARAESQVHGRPVENIHLHELGSLDALADILGVCLLIEELAPEKVLASPVHVGSGTVRCAHGLMPVPAPATELLLHGIPMYSGQIQGELCTPTGAALLAHFVQDFGPMPALRVEKSGYGLGTKDFETANALRVLLGETGQRQDRVLELVCNLDDMTPEALGFVQEELMARGALDAYTTHIGMKKNRPGIMLTCMCREAQREDMLQCLFHNTSTLGVREYVCDRYTLQRSQRTVETVYGPVRVKRAEGWGVCREKAEYEDLARIAREQGISLKEAEALVKEADDRGR
ncbi:MAG: nickel pincer cofactor biosynthesis protein LarC [Oscillospiraceae bacterium]|nr:nickel pincer cofactor biosynthesis protein LarC [Oscillospiraceae bacterium]MBQ9250954.1 nickel pincer cofactor biosynthesis protein LarC [Oscillospiraceae bacterium]